MLKIRCHKHPRYSGTASPRAACEACVQIYRFRAEVLRARTAQLVEARPSQKGGSFKTGDDT